MSTKRLFAILAAATLLMTGVILVSILYYPVRYYFHESRLKSDDKAIREYASNQMANDGERAIPYLKKWIKSDDEKLIKGSCRALAEMKNDAWKACLPELEKILKNEDSELTDYAAETIAKHDENWQETYKNNSRIITNIDLYTSWGIKSDDWHKRMRRFNRIKDEPDWAVPDPSKK